MFRLSIFSLFTLGWLALALPSSAECEHSRRMEIAPVDASGITQVRIVASAGSLEVVGKPTNTIRAGGKACASSDSRLEDIELRSLRRGDELEIRVDIDSSPRFFLGHRHASLDLEVELPEGLDVEIDDGSGSIEVTGVGALSIEDGSGSIAVRNCGATRIDDGSGEIDVAGIRGDLSIEDGSGQIDVADVAGTVRVDDGSGSVQITRIGGNVVIEDDGSGSIRVTEVRGDLRVGDHGSGGISFDRIDGRVSVSDD